MRSRVPRASTWLAAALTVALSGACGSGGGDDTSISPDGAEPDAEVTPPVPVAERPSKSGTIAISDDDEVVIMVNPETDTVSFFDASGQQTAQLDVGDEPSAVAIHPDNAQAFVTNRAEGTLSKIIGIGSGDPVVTATVEIGSEPTGVALSPTGATAYVAEWAEGRIAIIDTDSMEEIGSIDAPKNPRGVAVTNDGDQDDDDELIVVPEFYGEARDAEATDTSRTGRVRIYDAETLQPQTAITFAPTDSGFAPSTAPAGTPSVMTSPNQLWNANIVGGKIYVPSISSSPAAPVNFQTNVQPVVYVGDLEAHAEVVGDFGTVDLATLVRDQIPAATTKFFLADIVDTAFVGTNVMYVVSRGADVLQRVDVSTATPTLGSTQNFQIDLNVIPAGSTERCNNPTGVAIGDNNTAYINCWGTRQLGVVDLSQQALVATTESDGIDVDDAQEQRGLHFFFTGRGRWSNNSWSDCASCHPDGLSDNMTWIFGAGPRQSTSMDGSFSHFAGETQKQRVFNWTGIIDEMHDFERNTRGTQGGFGALTTANPTCGDPATEAQVNITGIGELATPFRGLQSCNTSWDDIEAYARTIRPPHALKTLDPDLVDDGRALFGSGAENANCVNCHGGDGWTASRLYRAPQLPNDAFTQPDAWPDASLGQLRWNYHTTFNAVQPATTDFNVAGQPDAPEAAAIGPNQVACTIRNVGTFGSDALELKNAAPGTTPGRAQGRLGYNVPSLYGLAVGAPYLHHGQAADLAELFDDAAWVRHATAGNPNWLTGDPATVAARKQAMIAFLLSIDALEEEQDLPAAFEGCPAQQ